MTVEALEAVELEPRILGGKWHATEPKAYRPAGRRQAALLWSWVLLVLLDVGAAQ